MQDVRPKRSAEDIVPAVARRIAARMQGLKRDREDDEGSGGSTGLGSLQRRCAADPWKLEALEVGAHLVALGSLNLVHVAEVFNPGIFSNAVAKMNLIVGLVFDINAPQQGRQFDADIPSRREWCKKVVQEQKPMFLIGSPLCTAFSLLLNLNQRNLDPVKYDELVRRCISHLYCTIFR